MKSRNHHFSLKSATLAALLTASITAACFTGCGGAAQPATTQPAAEQPAAAQTATENGVTHSDPMVINASFMMIPYSFQALAKKIMSAFERF